MYASSSTCVVPTRLEVDVEDDAITLRPETRPPKTPDVSIAWRGKRRVIVGAAPVSSQDIVRAIQAERDERTGSVLSRQRLP